MYLRRWALGVVQFFGDESRLDELSGAVAEVVLPLISAATNGSLPQIIES